MRLLARFLLSLLVASLAIFLLLRVAPGDPARVALGVTATDEAVAELSARLGTDRSLFVQYFEWMGGMLSGNFGVSLSSGLDMTPLIVDRAQVSLILCVSAMVLSLLIAIPVGTWAALHDSYIVGILSQLGIAIPSFLAGILLVAVFSVQLGWLPANGWVPPNEDFGAFVSRLILPVIALTAVQAAILTRYVRSAVANQLDADYLRTARALGQSPTQALMRHGLRNAAIPVLTITGVQLSGLIVGAVVIEQVFALPGIGSMLLDSVANRDLTTVQSIVMLLVGLTLVVTFIVDAIATWIDPRIGKASNTRRPA